jgi:DMSO/TMAO reductase YedYZ molybdopterin-dependent catalytic subunit
VRGLVRSPLTLTLDELKKFAIVSLPAALQCAGNGRTSFQPGVPGLAWGRGAVGNAVWTGVRLRDVLQRVGVVAEASHVGLAGYDDPPRPGDPPFVRSIALERALDRTTLLAFEMNGEPLPPAHGGPLRLVIPGWSGQNWLKWLRAIVVRKDATDGHFMREYSIRAPGGAGANNPITENRVKSIIAQPPDGTVVSRGVINIRGVALTGSGSVTALEVSVNDGPWQPAELAAQESPGAWQTWNFTLRAERPGSYTIAARATDSAGDMQRETTEWNEGGYLWNGIERVTIEVRE